jgi:hypothetical protein
MKSIRVMQIMLASSLLCAAGSRAQTNVTSTAATTNAPPATNALPATNTTPVTAQPEKNWAFSASVYTVFPPDSHEYVQPTIRADYDRLHLEARYNYEALDTGSLWVGYNFSGGEKLAWSITPMLGGIIGDTTGIAPGYEGSLEWWKLELYSEGEYVYDTRGTSGDFFYNWSELNIKPTHWLKLGIVTQRTHAYETDRDVQRGFLVGFYFKRFEITGYCFNPDESKPTAMVMFGAGF